MKYLFNSSGEWIAFKIDSFIYDTNGNWIGWTPWNDDYAVDTLGNYLGNIIADRLFYFYSAPYRGYPGYPGYPGYGGFFPIPSGAKDVKFNTT